MRDYAQLQHCLSSINHLVKDLTKISTDENILETSLKISSADVGEDKSFDKISTLISLLMACNFCCASFNLL